MSSERDLASVEERELRELLRPHRPDPARFREAVARRVADLERAPEAPEAQSDGWRKAAALLPPDLAAIALGSGKAWSAALLLPALALASVFGAFFASARSIDRSTRDAAPATADVNQRGARLPLPRNSPMRWGTVLNSAVQFGALAMVVAPVLLGSTRVVEVIVGLMALSMLTLALHVRGLALAGLLQRALVLRVCLGALSTVFAGCFLWASSFHVDDGRSALGLSMCGLVVLGGQALLASVYRSELTRGQYWSTVICAVLVGALITGPNLIDTSAPPRIRAYVESERLSVENLRGWEELAASVEALAAVGAPAPDLAGVRTKLEAAIDDGVDAHSWVWTAGARLGLIDAPHWRTLAARRLETHRLDSLLQLEIPVRKPDYAEYELHMLLATRELGAEQREALVRRVEAAWPTADEGRALSDAARCVRWLDLLGRPELVDARRADVHAILERHFVTRGGLFARLGGFTSNPTSLRTSFADATSQAVELMARLGTPEGVDLLQVRGFLRSDGLHRGVFEAGNGDLWALARAARLRLERQIGLPGGGPLGVVLAERLLLGVALIVLLCLFATHAAPPAGQTLAVTGGGARP